MKKQLRELIESLIFVSLEPLSLEEIKSVLQEFEKEEVEQAIKDLLESYVSNERGIQITLSGGGYFFSTKPEFDMWIRRFLKTAKKSRLSRAALETLSAIAYNQPITLAETSTLRSVDSTHTMKALLQKKLVKIVGRKKAPGRPLIYKTSDKFLTYFGLNNLQDLPSQEEISKFLEEKEFEE